MTMGYRVPVLSQPSLCVDPKRCAFGVVCLLSRCMPHFVLLFGRKRVASSCDRCVCGRATGAIWPTARCRWNAMCAVRAQFRQDGGDTGRGPLRMNG